MHVFSMKVLIDESIFTCPNKDGSAISVRLSESSEGLAVCRAKAVLSFLSYFKTLSTVPKLGIKPVTLRPAIQHPTEVLRILFMRRYSSNINALRGVDCIIVIKLTLQLLMHEVRSDTIITKQPERK